MDELSDLSYTDIEENSIIGSIWEYTLNVIGGIDTISKPFSLNSESGHLGNSENEYKSVKRSFSNGNPHLIPLERSNSSFESLEPNKNNLHKKKFSNNAKTLKTAPNIPKPNNSYAYNAIATKFEEKFNREIENLGILDDITKDNLINLLYNLKFLDEPVETSEILEIFKLLLKSNTINYLKSILKAVLKIKDETNLLNNSKKTEIHDKFPKIYANYFKSKKKQEKVEQPTFIPIISSFNYKILEKNGPKHLSQGDYLFSFHKSIEAKMERSAEKINKERYKECTFSPRINSMSKKIDSSPSKLKIKNSNSYKSLKDSKKDSPRTNALYEFAEVSKNLKAVIIT